MSHSIPSHHPHNPIIIHLHLETDVAYRFPGYKEVRMVAGKPGIAFVEYETEMESAVAMGNLQHFKITPTNLMVISFAKK